MAEWAKGIKSLSGALVSNWVFTNTGVASLAALWGISMGVLTYLTAPLSHYAPLSYGCAVSFGIILALIIARLFNGVTSSRFTEKPTFVEYRMEKGRINLVDKSNIYGEPFCMLNIHLEPPTDFPAGTTARNQRRIEKNNPVVAKELDLKTAGIRVTFDRPIPNSKFHVKIVSVGGPKPTRVNSVIDNRTASIDIADIANDCSFRVCFNEQL